VRMHVAAIRRPAPVSSNPGDAEAKGVQKCELKNSTHASFSARRDLAPSHGDLDNLRVLVQPFRSDDRLRSHDLEKTAFGRGCVKNHGSIWAVAFKDPAE
jgi:hypothetical protein